MSREGSWWGEPPRWAWTVIVISVVAIAIMFPMALNRQSPPADRALDAAAETATPSAPAPAPGPAPAAPAPTGAPGQLDVVAVGDGYTSGTAQGGVGPLGWPALLDAVLTNGTVQVAAEVGAGYVAASPSGLTLAALAGTVDLSAAEVVLVVSGRADDGPADQVAAAARELFAQVAAQAPQARLVVVGPLTPQRPVPADVIALRDAVRAEADAARAVWVDPLAGNWLVDRPGLLGPDGVYPDDEGHASLAEHIATVLEQVAVA